MEICAHNHMHNKNIDYYSVDNIYILHIHTNVYMHNTNMDYYLVKYNINVSKKSGVKNDNFHGADE